jgi:hypothetical protein
MTDLFFQQEFPPLCLELFSIAMSRKDRVIKSAVQLEFSIWKTFLILMYVCPCIIYENDQRYQLDAPILFIIINSSTCFGHLYAHLQEYMLYTTAYGVQH